MVLEAKFEQDIPYSIAVVIKTVRHEKISSAMFSYCSQCLGQLTYKEKRFCFLLTVWRFCDQFTLLLKVCGGIQEQEHVTEQNLLTLAPEEKARPTMYFYPV